MATAIFVGLYLIAESISHIPISADSAPLICIATSCAIVYDIIKLFFKD